MKSIPITAIGPDTVIRWHQILQEEGPEAMQKDIEAVERDCFVKDAIEEQKQRKGQMQSKPGKFMFNLGCKAE